MSLFLKKLPRRDEGDRAYNFLQLERTSNLHAHITLFILSFFFLFPLRPSVRPAGGGQFSISFLIICNGRAKKKKKIKISLPPTYT